MNKHVTPLEPDGQPRCVAIACLGTCPKPKSGSGPIWGMPANFLSRLVYRSSAFASTFPKFPGRISNVPRTAAPSGLITNLQ